MSQTSYAVDQGVAFAGMKVDSMEDHVESFIAEEAIPFGRAVSSDAGDNTEIHLPKNDVGTVTFDADFVASNTINGKIGGVAIAQVTFDTTHAATATLLLAAILAVTGVTAASKSSNGRVYTIEKDGVTITLSDWVVAAGSSQAGVTTAVGADDAFRGVALHQHNEKAISTGVAQYGVKDCVSVIRKGKVWVETGVAVTADQDAYVDLSGAIGKFTHISTNNMATGGKFRSTVGGAGIAQLELNLP